MGKSVGLLISWLLLIWLAAGIVAPGLSRISYPQPQDLVVLAFIPVGAWHAARYGRHQLPFLIYGLITASPLAWFFITGDMRIDFQMICYSERVHSRIALGCAEVVAAGLLCRAVPTWRARWEARWRYPQGHCQTCGYNLTGNTSGVCPECGTPTDSTSPSSQDTR